MEQKKDRRAVGVKVLPEGVEEYCERHTTALTELHERLLRETEDKTTTANFLVGELEGAILKMLVRMTQAKRILEVGMFTGYSALSFAERDVPATCALICDWLATTLRRYLLPAVTVTGCSASVVKTPLTLRLSCTLVELRIVT